LAAATDPDPDWDRLARLFETARALGAGARATLVAEARAHDPGLARELEGMLAADGEDSALEIERRLLQGSDGAALPPGHAIGPYRLVRPLAQGGMGEVYLAERTGGEYSQRVAVKLLRPGLEATGLLDRFRFERELLARLSHPAVVPLLDGGTTPEGRPYLVLQYVDGLPITAYCAERGLGRRARLRLFVELCRAVQYAHSNLIVHRDLKPSNILVDESGVVRLLDFGIAKLLSGHAAGDRTRAADPAPMTPDRAAPEQLLGEPVTTATDVWALGLLLRELITGRQPDAREPAGGPQPAEPDPERSVGRDVAAIVGRALRERPEERYAAAGEMADDVERWLDGKPVRARPDSLAYRARRFAGRHRAAVAAGCAAFLALLALAAVSTVQSARTARAGERAAAEERKAKAVVDLLLQTFGATDPQAGAVGDSVAIGDLLDLGEERAAGLAGQPEVQAALRFALGRIRLERGDFEGAGGLLGAARRAELARLGAADPATVPVRVAWARVLHATGDGEAAEAELRACLAVLDAAPEPETAALVGVLQGLGMTVHGDEGGRLLERAVALLRADPGRDPVTLADLLTGLAVRRSIAGDGAGARALFEEALRLFTAALGPESPRTLAVRSNLTQWIADPEERLAEHRSLLEIRRRRLGDRAYPVANSWSYLGAALTELGRHAEAEEAYRTALAIWTERAGADNRMTLRARGLLAENLERQGRKAEAAELRGGGPAVANGG
jgi:serine/threonine-protein kinase